MFLTTYSIDKLSMWLPYPAPILQAYWRSCRLAKFLAAHRHTTNQEKKILQIKVKFFDNRLISHIFHKFIGWQWQIREKGDLTVTSSWTR